MTITILTGDCIDTMRAMADGSVDSVVTDPPYEIGMMGRKWDSTGIAYNVEMWAEALRVLKPGGHLLAFSATRTQHRMVCAIEDAGFEIRDQVGWLYGSGFPKSLDVSKAIDKAAGAEREVVGTKRSGVGRNCRAGSEIVGGRCIEVEKRVAVTAPATPEAQQWAGWGTALKPAWEPICVARKPLIGTVAANVLEHGTGALNIDACRVSSDARPLIVSDRRNGNNTYKDGLCGSKAEGETTLGRWPANVIHDGSDQVLEAFAAFGSKRAAGHYPSDSVNRDGVTNFSGKQGPLYADEGTAARFYYCAKASRAERNQSKHPTQKPLALMKYLVKLITPPGGTVLDMFAGSGTTLLAAQLEGFDAVGIEQDAAYVADARKRLGLTFTLEAAD